MDHHREVYESRVLIIYIGGTIGMLVGPQGYRNEPHFLTETLRCQSRFHDPYEDSLFSHVGSIEGYRKWSSSPTSRAATPTEEIHTLSVKSTRPVLSSLLSVNPLRSPSTPVESFKKDGQDYYEYQLPSLVTPRMSIHPGRFRRVRYAIFEWDPLLDSSNINPDDWVRIATEIELNYSSFDAFVILHGTDTMAYTASALSFMLEDLGKTVILTGGQIPLSQLRNDAMDNFLGALSIAGHYIIPECCVYFNHCLYRGNRVSKLSSYDLDAFNSPNFPPLVDVGIDIVVNWNNVIRQTSLRRFAAHKNMKSRVAALRLFPGISAETVRTLLLPPVQGVVLETFGAGNAPSHADLVATLREASDRGIVIVAITQCLKGRISDAYETSRALLNAGVVPGGDMTPECALAKLGYLLSKPELSVDKIRELMRLSLRGELTPPAPRSGPAKPSMAQHFDVMQGLLNQMVRVSSLPLPGSIGPSTSPNIPEIHISSPSVEKPTLGVKSTKTSVPTPASAESATAAPWSWTAAEASTVESAFLPILMRFAVAKDDVEGLQFCLNYQAQAEHSSSLLSPAAGKFTVADMINGVDPASGWSALHVAAFTGSARCLEMLLHAGAPVHLRDALGHTALYYAARRGHTPLISLLRQAGANFGGSDLEGGFLQLEVEEAIRKSEEPMWEQADMDVQGMFDKSQPNEVKGFEELYSPFDLEM